MCADRREHISVGKPVGEPSALLALFWRRCRFRTKCVVWIISHRGVAHAGHTSCVRCGFGVWHRGPQPVLFFLCIAVTPHRSAEAFQERITRFKRHRSVSSVSHETLPTANYGLVTCFSLNHTLDQLLFAAESPGATCVLCYAANTAIRASSLPASVYCPIPSLNVQGLSSVWRGGKTRVIPICVGASIVSACKTREHYGLRYPSGPRIEEGFADTIWPSIPRRGMTHSPPSVRFFRRHRCWRYLPQREQGAVFKDDHLAQVSDTALGVVETAPLGIGKARRWLDAVFARNATRAGCTGVDLHTRAITHCTASVTFSLDVCGQATQFTHVHAKGVSLDLRAFAPLPLGGRGGFSHRAPLSLI